jgi:hypothetical protein
MAKIQGVKGQLQRCLNQNSQDLRIYRINNYSYIP